MAGAARCWMVAALAVAACQDANQIEVLHDAPAAAPRVFSWKLIPETAEMSDGVFATDREAWIVGPYGTLLHTVDGGAERSSWQLVETETTSPLSRVAAVATADGSFALVTGAGLVLRRRLDPPGWERLELNPVPGKRPSLRVAEDGRVEAWLATLDGLVYASDARTGMFTRATVPPGATEVVFSDDGDSWTAAPVGADCVPYRRVRGEVDWHPMPIPQPASPVAAPAPRLLGPRARPGSAASLSEFSSASACSGTELLVTLQRRKLWFFDGRKDDAVAEWDGKAWIRYPFSTDIAAASRPTPPPGTVTDLIRASGAVSDVEFVLAPQRTPPAISPGRLPVDPEAALRKDPHSRALAAWTKARGPLFSATDLWMRDPQIWVAGRDGFAHSTDGGQTWAVVQPEPTKPAAASLRGGHDAPRSGRPARALQWRIALDDRGTRGWAVSDDGDVLRYDGAWHAQLAIGPMEHALALSLGEGGDAAWLLTRNQLVHLTQGGPQIAAAADRSSMEALLVCPDGRSGWVRHDGYHWYAYDGAAWTKASARPQPACISPACAIALAQADPDTVVCARGDQLWSLRQGQTADGMVWQYPIPGLDPAQSRAVQLRADSGAVPGRLIAITQDGGLLRTDGHTDQPAIVAPGATDEGSDVVLSWALSGPPPVEPTFLVELCEDIVEGACAPEGTRWIPDSDVRQVAVGGRYFATVSPSKLRVQPDTRVQYRIRMTQGELRRKPVRIAEVTRGESPIQTAWAAVRPYAAGVALWFAALFGLWLVAPYAILRINDSTRAFLSEIPLMGGVLAMTTGAVLARRLVRTRRVVASWTSRALQPGAPGSSHGFLRIEDARLRAAFHAMASCQAAWLALHLERAFRTFEGSKFAIERTTYGEASATVLGLDGAQKLVRGIGLEDMRGLVAPYPRDPKLVLWIRGQGGVGKSHLACRIVRWLFKQDLRPHPVMVVVIDANAETQDALDAMIARRLAALTQASDVEPSLVGPLLAAGRVVLLFDGLTERSPKTIDVVCEYLESPQAPALAICTARSAHRFTARRSVTIEPMLLDADELLPFLSSYRLAQPPERRPPEELLEPVRRAAKRVAEGERRTPLTPLLVTLLWDEAVAGGAFSSLAVEAFNGYVARALVPAGDAAEHGELRRLALVRARVLGRLALGKNYRPGRWFTRESAVHALTEAGVAAAEHDVVHDFVAAGILQEDAGGEQLRFLLDPLSEYLCALCLLYSFDGNDAGWDQFLATLDALSPAARASADGFLIALADGWAAYGGSLQLTRAPRVDDVVPAER